MYFNNHLKLLMYTTKRHFWVAFILRTLLLSKTSPSLQFHDMRNRWHSQKKAVRCMFLPCLAKQQRKVPTDPMQCGVMQWCTIQCTGFCKFYCNERNLVHLLRSFLSSSSSTFRFLSDVIMLMSIIQVLNEAVGALMWHTIQLTKEVTILILAFTDNLFGQYLFDASDIETLLRTWRNSKLCGLLCESAVESTISMSK